MRVRPFRPKIYEPMRKFGVVIEDWPFVIGLALAGLFIPQILRLKLSYLPLPILGLLGGAVVGIAFFNWTRKGKPVGYLQHVIGDLLTAGHERRGWLPDDLQSGGTPRADYIIPPNKKSPKKSSKRPPR
jgi:hypothetical protein